MQRLVAAVERGRCPADEFSDQVIEQRHRGHGHAAGARGAVTPSEALARDLSRARERTLRLVDFDDAELRRQYDPLMSPLVWDLAHIGQQEELWLLRGGDPDRPGMLPRDVENLYDAFVHSRASRVDLPLLSPDQARAYCRTVRSAALDALDALPDEPGRTLRVRDGGQPREPARRNDAAGTESARRSAAAAGHVARCRPAGRGSPGHRCWCPAARSSWASTPPAEPFSLDNERPAHVVDVPAFRIGRVPVTNGEWRAVRRRRRLRAAAVVVGTGLGAPPKRGPDRAAVLGCRRADA